MLVTPHIGSKYLVPSAITPLFLGGAWYERKGITYYYELSFNNHSVINVQCLDPVLYYIGSNTDMCILYSTIVL